MGITLGRAAQRHRRPGGRCGQGHRLPRRSLALLAVSALAGLVLLGSAAAPAVASDCAALPATPSVFLPSSQVPAGTIDGAGSPDAPAGQPVPIGELPSLLPDLPGTATIPVAMAVNGVSYPLDVVQVPAGSRLYRGMALPTTSSVDPGDVRNVLAANTTWFGNERVATIYANSSWGRIEGRVVVPFATIRPITLVNLASPGNLAFLWASVAEEYRLAQATVARLTGPNPPTKNPEALLVARQHVKDLRRDLQVIRLTTGYDATWADQLRLLTRFGDAITADLKRAPGDIVASRNLADADSFVVRSDASKPWQRATLLSGCPGTDHAVTWGPGRSALNRVSFNADIDRVLADIIKRHINADGYIAPAMPSLLNPRGALLEEVALFSPRGALTAVTTATQQGP